MPDTNLYFYTTLALVLVLVGASFLLHAPRAAFLFAVLAVLATGMWARAGGCTCCCTVRCTWWPRSSPVGAWPTKRHAGLDAGGPMAAARWCAGLRVAGQHRLRRLAAARPAPEGGTVASGLRLGIIIACTWSVAGCLVGGWQPLLAGLDDRTVEPGALATVRTGVLALGTLLVAWIGRHAKFREWGWLLYRCWS